MDNLVISSRIIAAFDAPTVIQSTDLTITPLGLVGIATGSPGAQLEVDGRDSDYADEFSSGPGQIGLIARGGISEGNPHPLVTADDSMAPSISAMALATGVSSTGARPISLAGQEQLPPADLAIDS